MYQTLEAYSFEAATYGTSMNYDGKGNSGGTWVAEVGKTYKWLISDEWDILGTSQLNWC